MTAVYWYAAVIWNKTRHLPD